MALAYHPAPGEVLLCDYETGFVAPEMTKKRPVVIVSPRLRNRAELVTVVPLSTTEPLSIEPYHCELVLAPPLPAPFSSPRMWAKCDMLATVSRARLDRFRAGRSRDTGARRYVTGRVTPEQLLRIRQAILHGLGLGSLTVHL